MNSKKTKANKSKRNEEFNGFIETFSNLSEKIDSFLSCDPKKSNDFIDLTKNIFNFNKCLINESISNDSNILSIKSLDELFTNGFDEEGVWQQIQLNNEPLLDLLVKEVATLSVESYRLTPKVEDQINDYVKTIRQTNSSEMTEKTADQLMSENSDELMSENESDSQKKTKRVHFVDETETKPKRKSVVDDMFFKLHELEDFLNKEDLKEEKNSSVNKDSSDESDNEDYIDYFEDDSELSGEDTNDGLNGRDAMFKDFFDGPNGQRVSQKTDESSDESEINEEIDTRDVDINDINREEENEDGIDLENYSSDDSEDEFNSKKKTIPSQENPKESSEENKSEFERISESLKEKIEKQERLNLLSKSWQMSGEITSDRRPENSLLEEHLHFDHTTRPAPLVTEETTQKLEDIIKQRVKDNAFDNVIRKVKPKEKPFEYKRRITLESEKSKQSLAQIYENEYIKQQQKEKETEQNPIHIKINKLMTHLFVRLDALSNFNFTPRPPQPEVKIINNLPAITVEEVTPMTTSDVSLLAPQEVFYNQRRELQSNSEKTETDRKRSRRIKKKIQSKKAKFTESKQNAKNIEKEAKSWSETKQFSSSKKFFEKLEEKKTEVVRKKKLEKKDSIKHSNKLKL